MKKYIFSLSIGFITMMGIAMLVAMASAPFLSHLFGETIRKEDQDGILLPALLGGYFSLTLLMTFGFNFFFIKITDWKKKGLTFGLFCGLIAIFSDHLIIAGWSRLPILPMFVSGITDMLAPIATGLVISYFQKETKNEKPISRK
ncbi:MAG: hypothetical protein JKY54_05940 [Flavobacteriales bacterium]|nr:hypothetical protein [Flavobacteriales bacterium]